MCECERERKVVIEFACRKEREREFYMTISEEMKSHRKRVCVRACLRGRGKGQRDKHRERELHSRMFTDKTFFPATNKNQKSLVNFILIC